MAWQTRRMAATLDTRAPDGSEIRLLLAVSGGSMVHCSLQPGEVTRAVRHRTVDEMWVCVSGAGRVWRKAVGTTGCEEVVDVEPGWR